MSARHVVVALSAAVALGACGGESGSADSARTPTPAGGGAGALGGGAQTATLARQENVKRPRGRLAWSAWRVELEPGRSLRHRHGPATVLTEAGEHRLTGPSGTAVLAVGKGASVVGGELHRHAAAAEASTYSEVVLAPLGARLPRAPNARRLFQSDVVRGVPERPTLHFIEVRLPPGSETSVHTHPGPEFIVGTQGRFDYENAIEGARKFGPGDTAGIPPGTAVQKRNREDAEAVFLSWFLVDPDKPFAPGARFPKR